MPSKSLENHRKAQAERLQAILHDLLTEEENKYCADCDAKQPRWASWNLGVFVCIRCAGIHRSIGVQVSKVKSVNLDSWTPEQVQSMRVMGNAKAKAVYEAELPRDYRRPQTEQQLEMFIRAKYEQKRYMLRDWQPPKVDVADLIPALEKGQHRSSFKKAQPSLKISDCGLSLQPAKSPNTKQQSQAPTLIPDVQLLDFSDTAPASSSNGSNQKVGDTNAFFAMSKDGGDDVPVAIDALRITEKSDGVVDEELEDMFGPIVSAPRSESHSEPPGELEKTVSDTSTVECNVQQSASTNNLGDLAALAAPNTNSVAAKKSNADILALFGTEPLVRPSLQNPNVSQFPQNSNFDAARSGIPVQHPQFPYPVQGVFSNSGVPFAACGSSQGQQQFPLPNNPAVPPVGGMIGGFMNNETFAIFAAASPFATASGPAVSSSSFLGPSVEQTSSTTQPSVIASSGFNGGCVGVPIRPSGLSSLGTNSTDGTTVSSSNLGDQWPSSVDGGASVKLPFQSKPAQGNGDLGKDPFASLNNCFANFDQFANGKTSDGSRAETGNGSAASAVTPNASLWS